MWRARECWRAPAWGLEPPDIVRLAERARKERKAIYDVLQLPQGELPFDGSHAAHGRVAGVSGRAAKDDCGGARRVRCLSDLLEWLEIPQRAGEQDRKYVKRLAEFVKEWEAEERDAASWRSFWSIWITSSRRTERFRWRMMCRATRCN